MQRETLSVTNSDILETVTTYISDSNIVVLYIVSGVGYISDAMLRPENAQNQWRRYQGQRRIDSIFGHFQPTNPHGFVRIKLESVDPGWETSIATRLFTPSTVILNLYVIRRPPPVVFGRRRIQAAPP